MDKDGTRRRSSAAEERFHHLHGTLCTRICMLDYPPGTRLGETALAAEFGVSRTPLRRVLGRLQADGLVRSVQGVGTIVTDIDTEELTQVYQLRMEFAELAGRLSPMPPDARTIGTFRQLVARSRELAGRPTPRRFAELNMDYFTTLMRLVGNGPLREISARFYYQTARIWLQSIPKMDLAQEVAIFSRELAEVLSAVEIGDMEAVGHIRRSHISMSFTRLKRQGCRNG